MCYTHTHTHIPINSAADCCIHPMFLSRHIRPRKGAVNRKIVNVLHLPPPSLLQLQLTSSPLSGNRVKSVTWNKTQRFTGVRKVKSVNQEMVASFLFLFFLLPCNFSWMVSGMTGGGGGGRAGRRAARLGSDERCGVWKYFPSSWEQVSRCNVDEGLRGGRWHCTSRCSERRLWQVPLLWFGQLWKREANFSYQPPKASDVFFFRQLWSHSHHRTKTRLKWSPSHIGTENWTNGMCLQYLGKTNIPMGWWVVAHTFLIVRQAK